MIFNLCRRIGYRWFNTLLEEIELSKCADPRDRIFAIQSLLHKVDPVVEIQPDYEKDIVQLFTEVFVGHSSRNSSLDLIAICDIAYHDPSFPTWLPNYTLPKATKRTVRAEASGRSAAVFEMRGAGILRVGGRTLGCVERSAGHNITADSSAGDIEQELYQISQQLQVSDSQLEAFGSVLCGGAFEHFYSPGHMFSTALAQNFPNLKLAVEYLLGFISPSSKKNDSRKSINDLRFLHFVQKYTVNRKVYKTSSGTFGFSASSTETGDVAVALLGLDEVMVLRSTGRATYQVVGESYCHGYMTSEAFLGPLPNTHRMVWNWNQGIVGLYPTYLDVQSGSSSVEDPRLGDLPEGWKVIDHEHKDIGHFFENTETGEQTLMDPRLTPVVLEARGVKIEYFDLV